MRRLSFWVRLLPVVAVGVAAAAACGGGDGDATADADDGGQGDTGPIIDNADVDSLVLDPPTATLVVQDGTPPPTATFTARVKLKNGTTQPATGAVLSTRTPELGPIDPAGVYRPTGALGGVATLVARWNQREATSQVTVKIVVNKNDANLAPADQDALRAAVGKDPTAQWAYPYDGTVFPRGILGPTMMWFGQGADEPVLVRLKSATFEYENFVKASDPARVGLDPAVWQRLTDSTAGEIAVHVARKPAALPPTVLVDQKWRIAPGTMRGTIYYWANSKGRVMRIKPGASAPDDFTAGLFAPTDTIACTMTCHSVSSNGQVLVSGGDIFGGSFDLLPNQVRHDLGGALQSPERRAWNFGGLTHDGAFVVRHGTTDGLFDTMTGAAVPSTGLENGKPHYWPSFGADAKSFYYIDLLPGGATSDVHAVAYDPATHAFTNDRAIATAGADPAVSVMATPSGTPDGKWVVFQRGSSFDTRGACDTTGTCNYTNRGVLAMAPTTPGDESRLDLAGNVGVNTVAGDRDRKWDFEPTVAPVSAGGYFWVAFTSRRTYGNLLTGAPQQTKQIWITAIDEDPAPEGLRTKDPSHPAFWLPGQEADTLNMRAFWVRDPCKQNGDACTSSGECCNSGTCEAQAGSNAATCKAATCAPAGAHCEENADCCDVTTGIQCINHACAMPGPH